MHTCAHERRPTVTSVLVCGALMDTEHGRKVHATYLAAGTTGGAPAVVGATTGDTTAVGPTVAVAAPADPAAAAVRVDLAALGVRVALALPAGAGAAVGTSAAAAAPAGTTGAGAVRGITHVGTGTVTTAGAGVWTTAGANGAVEAATDAAGGIGRVDTTAGAAGGHLLGRRRRRLHLVVVIQPLSPRTSNVVVCAHYTLACTPSKTMYLKRPTIDRNILSNC